MKRLLLLSLLALLPAPSALADGCPLPCSGQSASPIGSKFVYVQPQGPGGELVAYNTATRRPRFALPPGTASADGHSYYSAARAPGGTRLTRFEVSTGEPTETWLLTGRWGLAAVSPSGRRIALIAYRHGRTIVQVFDRRSGRAVHVLRLRGSFEVETVSGDGKRLFLIEHLAHRRYNVRQYDLSRERLVASPLRAAGVKIMAGYAWSGVASPDGHWLLTLYLSTARREAFVHSLDLERSLPACIALPSGSGSFANLKQYSLTLTPDGTRLFAANPALGVVAELDLVGSRVRDVARFRPALQEAATRASTLSTISRNGRTLYFSAGRDLWAYDSAYRRVRGPYATYGKVVGVGYGAGDRRVFAVRRDGRMLAFDAATGGRLASRAR
jgi:hypothetical protein